MKNIIFHVGHHKTGTTWLQNIYFQQDIFNLLNDTKKPWDDALCRMIIQSEKFKVEECKKLIQKRKKEKKISVLSAERLSGHPISGGYDMEEIAKRLFKLSPNAQVIISKRNPKAFTISVYKQMIKEGYCGTLQNFLFDHHWKTSSPSKDYFLQENIVKTYKNLFGEKNVLVLSFEEFEGEKDIYLQKLEKFLNVEVGLSKTILNEKLNKSLTNRQLVALRRLNLIRRSELNPFPIINIGGSIAYKISYIFSFLCSGKLIENEKIDEYYR